jgi:hypothetical protein
MAVDASDLLAIEGKDVTVTRTAANAIGADGLFTAGSTTTFTARMVIWPASGRDRQLLPEGQRGNNAVSFVSSIRLEPTIAPSGRPGDRFSHDGYTFEVTRSSPWGELANVYGGVAVAVGQ